MSGNINEEALTKRSGHDLSLAENTVNKSASLSTLNMGTRSLFCIFNFFQNLDHSWYLQKYSSKTLPIYLGGQKRTTKHMFQVLFNYID